ncbi:MAG TPA: hypothetical protein VKZ79_18825 [Alphaproteobacteria bacterium]|nr:hypothetical protein [Alphaproteobacteria bacterium]
MLPADERFLSLVDAIYAAAVDETLWPSVLEGLTAISKSQPSSLRILEDRRPGHDRGSDTRHYSVDTRNAGDRLQSSVALHRTRAKSRCGPNEADQFAILFRHVEHALEIGFRLGTLGNLQQATFDLLNRNPLAIVLLDDRGRVILANGTAQKLNAASDGVRISAEGLTLAHGADNRKLQRCIVDALNGPRDISARPGGTLWALRPSGKRSFSILVSSLSQGSFTMTSVRPAVGIVIADPDQDEVLPIERLRTLYGLTPAEARLAARLSAGDTLKSAAAAIGIGYATARSQLAAVFRKTETRRQGDLIRLILTTILRLPS